MLHDPQALRDQLVAWLETIEAGPAVRPGHYLPFRWPPKSIAVEYHVHGHEFTEHRSVLIDDLEYGVEIAHTAHGVFGRVDRLWNEARGETVEEVLEAVISGAMPLIRRQREIATQVGRSGRFEGSIMHFGPLELLKLLYSQDRSISHEAITAIETSGHPSLFTPSLIAILRDRRHPMRRAAQWCALDLFEDLPPFAEYREEQKLVIDTIRDLIWDAEDDFARTIYKAGVVLGGHICTDDSADALLEAFSAPSKIGRRACFHASFHLAEWQPGLRSTIVERLERAFQVESEPILVRYLESLIRDIANEASDHVSDPVFEDEMVVR